MLAHRIRYHCNYAMGRYKVQGTRCVCVCVCVCVCMCAWAEHISSAELLALWGDTETIEEKLDHRRMEWLGHVAGMEDSRMPRQVLFDTFLQRRPAHGPRKRWKDGVVRDLRSRDLLASWLDLARESRSAWRSTYSSVACNQHRVQPVECSGGMAVHCCSSWPSVSASISVTASNLSQVLLVPDAVRHTVTYAVVASNAGDLLLRSMPSSDSTGSSTVPTHVCFRRSQDLVRHQASCSLSLSNFPSGTA